MNAVEPGRRAEAVDDPSIAARTDSYFNRTKAIVARFGDCRVTYAVFLRRPVISAPRLAVDWLKRVAEARGTAFDIELMHEEGAWVGAGDPIFYLSGPFVQLVDLETIILQKLGAACVARTTPTRCASNCRASPSSPWRRGTAPAPRCRR
jgi:nicotinate phosphoribosyltransferase